MATEANVDPDRYLCLEGVHKRFGNLHVLRGVDLDVGKGQVVCVIGPSGSGKSTLLRCINLLEPPEQGRITLEGKEITGGRAAEGASGLGVPMKWVTASCSSSFSFS